MNNPVDYTEKLPGIKDLLCGVASGNRASAQRVKLCAALALALSVPFCYLKILVPAEKEFLFFQAGFYPDIKKFIDHFTYWFVLAVLSSLYFFLCKRHWSACLGILSLNYWWISLCVIGWGIGWIQEGEQFYMLPMAIISWYYCLYKRRARRRSQVCKERKKGQWKWSSQDYISGAVVLFAVALTHIYLFFPKTENFYFFYSGWFHNVQRFIYFFGLLFGAVLWLALWLFDRGNEWLYPYIAWPFTMFIFRFAAMLTAETKVATVEQNYCFLLPMAMLLGFFLCRMRKSLYIRTHRKEVRRIMTPGPITKLQGELAAPIRWAKYKLLINCENISFWRDMVIGVVLLSSWFTIRSDIADFIHKQLIINEWIYSSSYDMLSISHIISVLLYIMAFFLWLKFCPWLCIKPYVAFLMAMCCFVLLGELNVNPYTGSGYYMLVIGITLGSQLWRERGYFLWEATCYDELQREGYSKQYAILKAKKRLCLKECEREKQELREHWDQVQKNREECRRKVEELEALNLSSIDNKLFRSEWRDHMMQLRYKMEQAQKEYDYIEQYLLKRYNSISKMESKHWEYFRKKEEKLIKKYSSWISGHESFVGETISSN